MGINKALPGVNDSEERLYLSKSFTPNRQIVGAITGCAITDMKPRFPRVCCGRNNTNTKGIKNLHETKSIMLMILYLLFSPIPILQK